MNTIRIGTRGSRLALWQADYIEHLLHEKHPDLNLQRIIIKTEGDKDQRSSLTQIGGQGVFTKAIEEALLNNEIDVAVHSLKDLPSAMPNGLVLAAVPERGPVEDVLVSKSGMAFADLKQGAQIATGSIRRQSQLLNLRTDLNITDLRGNIETRLHKLMTQNLDGIIMARAALVRLELNQVKYSLFKTNELLPAVGQGAVGVQIRSADKEIYSLINSVNHASTFMAVTAERALLNELDSGCQFPIGGFAHHDGEELVLNGFVGSEDGKEIYRETVRGQAEQAEELGRKLAKQFIQLGAHKFLTQ